MKIFHFDHESGKRGALITERKYAGWTGPSVQNQVATKKIEPIQYAQPRFGRDVRVTVHVDAGRDGVDGPESYREPDRWVCFCLGKWGEDRDGSGGWWEWCILPPTSAVVELGARA